MTSDSESIVCNRVNPSFTMTFRQAELKKETVQEPEESLEGALESGTKDPFLSWSPNMIPHQQSNHASLTSWSHQSWKTQSGKLAKKNQTHFCETGWQIVVEGDRESTVGNILCLIRGNDCQIQEHIFLQYRRRSKGNGIKGPFEVMFKRNFECWTHSSSFADGFTKRALNSAR